VKYKRPTRRQLACLNAIVEHIRAHGYPPTTREIAQALDLASVNRCDELLHGLEKRACIKRTPMVSRGIQVMDRGKAYSRGYIVNVAERCGACARELFGARAVREHVCAADDLAVAS
jgi:SOS-response transcriptional repressor LexA